MVLTLANILQMPITIFYLCFKYANVVHHANNTLDANNTTNFPRIHTKWTLVTMIAHFQLNLVVLYQKH